MSRFRRATFLIAVSLATLAACSGKSPLSPSDQTSYVDDNQRLLDSLPQIPGSERIDLQTNPYCVNEPSPKGYSTFEHRRTKTVMTHDEIVDFYTQNLGDDWKQLSRYDVPIDLASPPVHGIDTEVTFHRGEETLFLGMIPVEGGGSHLIVHSPNDYSVGVDAHRRNASCNNG